MGIRTTFEQIEMTSPDSEIEKKNCLRYSLISRLFLLFKSEGLDVSLVVSMGHGFPVVIAVAPFGVAI